MIRYYTDKGTIDPELVDGQALKVARQLVVRYNDRIDQRNSIKSSQLRKFYGDVKSLELTWSNQQKSDAAFLGILPQIKMLKAKVAYAKGRGVVPQSFVDWINENVDQINKPDDFKAFLLHFEAVVGFCYGEGLKD